MLPDADENRRFVWIAGAWCSHAPVMVSRKFVCAGVWRETLSDGSVQTVADLTAALWKVSHKRIK